MPRPHCLSPSTFIVRYTETFIPFSYFIASCPFKGSSFRSLKWRKKLEKPWEVCGSFQDSPKFSDRFEERIGCVYYSMVGGGDGCIFPLMGFSWFLFEDRRRYSYGFLLIGVLVWGKLRSICLGVLFQIFWAVRGDCRLFGYYRTPFLFRGRG